MIHYHPGTKTKTLIPTSLFGEITLLVCDQQGKVWIGADSMLFAWLIKEKKFVLFGESDGAILNEYLSKPQLLSMQGDIYMGGVKGLLHINSKLPLTTYLRSLEQQYYYPNHVERGRHFPPKSI